MWRHLPCVEEVDPGLALLDLEQRAVVGEQPRLELLDHLDLQQREIGRTFTHLLGEMWAPGGAVAAMGAYKMTNLVVKEVSMPPLKVTQLAIRRNKNLTHSNLFDLHIGQVVNYRLTMHKMHTCAHTTAAQFKE